MTGYSRGHQSQCVDLHSPSLPPTTQCAWRRQRRQWLLWEFGEVFGLIGLELLDAGLAAKFDLLAIIYLCDGFPHRAKTIAADEASLEWVRFGICGMETESEVKDEGGGDEGDFGFHDEVALDLVLFVLFFEGGSPLRNEGGHQPRGRSRCDKKR